LVVVKGAADRAQQAGLVEVLVELCEGRTLGRHEVDRGCSSSMASEEGAVAPLQPLAGQGEPSLASVEFE
jgi:hypothetical protein